MGLDGVSPYRRGRRVQVVAYSNRLTEPLAQQRDDLLDLHNLLRGGADEGEEAFPRLLSQQSQARTRGDGGAHGRVVGEGGEDGGQVGV